MKRRQFLKTSTVLPAAQAVDPLALFHLLAQTNLTTEQMTVVEDTLKAASGRMFDAAARGDTNALEAMREVSESRAIGRMR